MSALKALKNLRSPIRIGGYDIVIEVKPSALETVLNWGLYDANNCTITINKAIQSQQRVLEVVIHEVMHAVYEKAGLTDTDDEERTVTALSIGLMQVYRDNPWFADWIARWSK